MISIQVTTLRYTLFFYMPQGFEKCRYIESGILKAAIEWKALIPRAFETKVFRKGNKA